MCGVRIQAISTRSLSVFVAVAASVIAFDQWVKRWMETNLADGPITVIDGVLWWSYAENNGAAFGLFQNGGPILGLAAVLATGLIIWNLPQVSSRTEELALALVLGGALGNLVDRIIRGTGFLDGAVIDFIKVPNFPNFNVADSSITIGVVILLAASLFGGPSDSADRDGAPNVGADA